MREGPRSFTAHGKAKMTVPLEQSEYGLISDVRATTQYVEKKRSHDRFSLPFMSGK
jgi:hypothetical protein